MESKRFEIGEQFYLDNILCRIRDITANGVIEIEDTSGKITKKPLRELVEALFNRNLERVITGKHARPSKEGKLSTARQYADYNEAPENLRHEAELREKYILPLIDLRSRERSDECILERIAEVKQKWPKEDLDILGNLSVRTTRRWLKDYEEGDRDRMALIPMTHMRGGLGEPKINPQVDAILINTIHENKRKSPPATVDDVRHLVAPKLDELNRNLSADEQLSVPAKDTVIARIRALGLEKKFGLPSTKGKPSSRSHSGGANDRGVIPLEKVYIDTQDSDFIAIDSDYLPSGRPKTVLCLDDATAYPLGRYPGFDSSYLSVAECIYHGILPKPPFTGESGQHYQWLALGIPREIVADNGKIYISKDFRDSCDSLQITLTNAPVRMPEFKAAVERQFRTLNTQLIHKLPGTTFSSIVQRGSYDSKHNACIMMNDFERILDTGIVGLYANSPHRGLDMDTPTQRWLEATSSGWLPRLPISADDLVRALGVVFTPVMFHYGFDIELIRYNSFDLQHLLKQYSGRELKIKINPGDLSRAYVIGFADKPRPLDDVVFAEGPIEVPARDDENYTLGLSLWKHRVIRRFVRHQQKSGNKTTLVILGQAKRDLQKIVADSMHEMKLAVRGRVARFNETPPSLRRSGENEPTLTLPSSAPVSLPRASSPATVATTSDTNELSFDEPPITLFGQDIRYQLAAGDDQSQLADA